MTAIACRDGVLAADSGRWHGELCFGVCEKIFQIEGRGWLAAAGVETAILPLVRWLREGADKPEMPSGEDDGLTAIWLRPDGLYRFDGSFECVPEGAPFVAVGAHHDFLMGAMAAGASAEEAVELAVRHCAFAREPVQVARL